MKLKSLLNMLDGNAIVALTEYMEFFTGQAADAREGGINDNDLNHEVLSVRPRFFAAWNRDGLEIMIGG